MSNNDGKLNKNVHINESRERRPRCRKLSSKIVAIQISAENIKIKELKEIIIYTHKYCKLDNPDQLSGSPPLNSLPGNWLWIAISTSGGNINE